MKRFFQAFAALSLAAMLTGCYCPGPCQPYGPNCGGWCGPSPICGLVNYPFVLLEQILCLPAYGCGGGYAGGGCCGYYGGCPTPCCDTQCCDTPCYDGMYGPQMGGDCCQGGSCCPTGPAAPMMDGQWMQSPPTPVGPPAAPPSEQQQQEPATQNGTEPTTMYSHPMGGYPRSAAPGAPRHFAPAQSMAPMQSMAPAQTMAPVQATLPPSMPQQQWIPVNH